LLTNLKELSPRFNYPDNKGVDFDTLTLRSETKLIVTFASTSFPSQNAIETFLRRNSVETTF